MDTGDVYQSITPLLKISSIFGVLPIGLTKENCELTARFNILGTLLSGTYMIITTVLIYEEILVPNTQEKSKYGIGVLYIGVLFIFIGNIITLYTIFIMNIIASKNIASVINKISKADHLMKVMINKVDYTSHFKYEICVITSGILIVLVQIILHYFTFNCKQKLLDEKMLFLLALPLIIRMILGFQYTMLIKLLHERFIVLNKELYNLFLYKSRCTHKYNIISTQADQNCKERTKEPKDINTQLRNIEIIMELHDILSDAGIIISKLFSLQILACFATYLINEIFTVFYLYFEMVHHHYIPAFHWFGWIITINLEMLQITSICHQTTYEANRTASVINKIFLAAELNETIRDKLFIFLQQIQHRPLQFSGCGLFPIDGRLIFMVTCASSTYLLVMFQYQEGIEIHCLKRNDTMY